MKTLQQHSYILLSTLRKNGNYVATPVWFASDDNTLFAFSNADAGKVKRLRNFNSARVAPCSVTGRPLGDELAATATLITDEAGIEYAHRQLIRKYGWQMRLLDIGAKIGGRYNKRAFIQIELGQD